jgi:hypothetical protein
MNTFVTLMEAYGTKLEHKIPKNPMTHPPSPPQRKNILGLLGACCFTSLAARNFYLTHVKYHFSVMSHV